MKAFLELRFFLLIAIACLTSGFGLAGTPGEDGSCGTSGDVEERIQNCNSSKQSSKGMPWALVTRTATHKEVWKDTISGLLWGDRLDNIMKHSDALQACDKEFSLDERGNITNVIWELPSIGDYRQADEHGIREILPNMAAYFFWSSSVLSGYYRDFAWGFYGGNGSVYHYYRGNDAWIRCAGR